MPLQIKRSEAALPYSWRRSRSSRRRHAAQVTYSPEGSAQPDPGPGSSAQSDIRQWGVTAWNTGLLLFDTWPDFRSGTKTRSAQITAFRGRLSNMQPSLQDV